MPLTESIIIIIIINTLSYYYTALSFGRFGWFGGGWCAASFGFSLSAATSPMPLSAFFLSSRRPSLRLLTSFYMHILGFQNVQGRAIT